MKLQQAQEYVATEQRRQQEYEQQPRRPGRAPDWQMAQRMAEMFRRQAAERLAACQERQQRARQAVRGLGDDYHPFDAHSGQPLEAAEVQERLEQRVAAVEQVVAEASLGERGREAVSKSRRWLVLLAATLSWYWAEVRRRIAALELSSSAERAVYQQLLPGLYWQAAAERGRDAEQRQRLRQLSQRLLRRAWSPRGPLGRLAGTEREAVVKVVREAAGLFVRSSSCVEGRNGRLSLYHQVQPNVLLPRSEVDQNPVLLEGGHLVADDFLGVGRSVADRLPHFLKDGLHVGGELRDVAVDVGRLLGLRHRRSSLNAPAA